MGELCRELWKAEEAKLEHASMPALPETGSWELGAALQTFKL